MNVKNIKKTSLDILLAGMVGELAFEIYAWVVSPVLFGLSLSPLKLVTAIVKKLSGFELAPIVAFLIHASIGVFVFSAAVFLFHTLTKIHLWFSGIITGLGLWFVAQGVLAPFIGRSFMMDFGPYTQSSFVGHVGMCLIIAAVLKSRSRLEYNQNS